MCLDMCTGMCADMCIDMCTDMWTDMCIDMCTDMFIDMCTDMCMRTQPGLAPYQNPRVSDRLGTSLGAPDLFG